MEELKQKLKKLFYSNEFGHVDGHEWMMGEESLNLLWGFITANFVPLDKPVKPACE